MVSQKAGREFPVFFFMMMMLCEMMLTFAFCIPTVTVAVSSNDKNVVEFGIP
jgi:hypothetical protein